MNDTVMETIPTDAYVTLDDLMNYEAEFFVEVVDGRIVEMSPVGGKHQFVINNLFRAFDANARQHDAGLVFSDGLIYLLNQKRTRLRGARVPDVSFIRKRDIRKDWNIDQPYPGAPTFMVEVFSPGDDMEKTAKRIQDCFAAGTEEGWIAFPNARTVYQYQRHAKIVTVYSDDDMIDCGAYFPGLTLSLHDIFVMPEL